MVNSTKVAGARAQKSNGRSTAALELLEQRRLLSVSVTPLNPEAGNANILAERLIVTTTGLAAAGDVTYIGGDGQGGLFNNFLFRDANDNILRMPDGVILTSGRATTAMASNDSPSAGEDLDADGDADLEALIATETNDANVLIVRFTAADDIQSILFDFVFASEEFPDFIGSINDAFAAYLDGVQVSFDSFGDPITVNNNFFELNNTDITEEQDPDVAGKKVVDFDTQYDGLTPRIRTQAPLNTAIEVHELKFVIADAVDGIYDSAVFISRLQGSREFLIAPTTVLPEIGVIQPESNSIEVAEDIGTYTLNIHRVGGTSGQIIVDYTIIPGSAKSILDFNDADGVDPLVLSGKLVFEDGETVKSITITIVEDGLPEPEETFTVRIANPTDGILGDNPVTSFTIVNSDPLFAFGQASYLIREDSDIVEVVVKRLYGSAYTSSVMVQSQDVQATAGEDYVPILQTLTFLPGETEKTVQFQVLADAPLDEPIETLRLTLSTDHGTIGSPTNALISIRNYNPYPPAVAGEVTLTTFRGRVTAVSIPFTRAIDHVPLSGNYRILSRGPLGIGREINIPLAGEVYDVATNTLTLIPRRPLAPNIMYQVHINGDGIRDPYGMFLDGDGDGTPGGSRVSYFAYGKRIAYYDGDGDLVRLALRGPGMMTLTRNRTWDGLDLSLSDIGPNSVLVGSVLKLPRSFSNGSTILQSLNGADDLVHNILPPAFQVGGGK
jgi:hypothetical protein